MSSAMFFSLFAGAVRKWDLFLVNKTYEIFFIA